MISKRSIAFPSERFTSVSQDKETWPVRLDNPAAVTDDGTVKIGGGGGAPFARYPAIEDAGKVKIGGGGGKPFARR